MSMISRHKARGEREEKDRHASLSRVLVGAFVGQKHGFVEQSLASGDAQVKRKKERNRQRKKERKGGEKNFGSVGEVITLGTEVFTRSKRLLNASLGGLETHPGLLAFGKLRRRFVSLMPIHAGNITHNPKFVKNFLLQNIVWSTAANCPLSEHFILEDAQKLCIVGE